MEESRTDAHPKIGIPLRFRFILIDRIFAIIVSLLQVSQLNHTNSSTGCKGEVRKCSTTIHLRE